MPIGSTRSWNLTINPADAQKFALMSMIQAFAKSLESEPQSADETRYNAQRYNELLSTLTSLDAQVAGVLSPLQETITPSNMRRIHGELRMRAAAMGTYMIPNALPSFLQMFSSLSSSGFIQPMSPFPVLSELKPILDGLGLSEKWWQAAVSLSLVELLVDRGVERFNLKPTPGHNWDFYAKLGKLAEYRKKQAQPFDEPMIGALKGARNIVIHSGKEPTENGQKDIMKYLKELHRAVSQ
jgi:hypothetical protein